MMMTTTNCKSNKSWLNELNESVYIENLDTQQTSEEETSHKRARNKTTGTYKCTLI